MADVCGGAARRGVGDADGEGRLTSGLTARCGAF